MKKQSGILKLSGPTAYKGLDNQMVVEGMVQNTGDRSLKEIMIIVSWYDEDKEYLCRMKKKIGIEELSAHESSSYRLVGKFDLRMNHYNIGFYNKEKKLLSVYHFQYAKP